MQPLPGTPLWAVYLVAKRELVVVPLALGFAALLALRVLRSLGWAERSPYQPVTLLPGWLLWLGAFALFYTGLFELLSGLASLVAAYGVAAGWSLTAPYAQVPAAPALLFDAGVLAIGALWILLTGREYPAPGEAGDEADGEAEDPESAAPRLDRPGSGATLVE